MEPGAEAETKECEFCGETIKRAAVKCRHCGESLDGRRKNRVLPQTKIDSAATLSLVFGLTSLVGALVCLPIGFLAPVAIWKGMQSRKLARTADIPAPGTAIAGIVLGWLVSALMALMIVVMVVAVVAVGL